MFRSTGDKNLLRKPFSAISSFMGLRYDEIELTDSAYRHGYDDEDVAEMLRSSCLIISNRRGRLHGYEVFGRNVVGEYLLAAARIVEYEGVQVLRVFHINGMTDTERRRYQRQVHQ